MLEKQQTGRTVFLQQYRSGATGIVSHSADGTLNYFWKKYTCAEKPNNTSQTSKQISSKTVHKVRAETGSRLTDLQLLWRQEEPSWRKFLQDNVC